MPRHYLDHASTSPPRPEVIEAMSAWLRRTDAGDPSRIHAEGGPTLLAQLVAADVLDELLLTVSPVLAGGAYADGADISRVLHGTALDDAPRDVRLHQVLEDDGSLFLSYRLH